MCVNIYAFYYHIHYLNLRNDIEFIFQVYYNAMYFIYKAHDFWFSLPFILYIFDIEKFNTLMYS